MKYCTEGGGELASVAQQKSARFHGLPDSEIYTIEYMLLTPQYCVTAVQFLPNLQLPKANKL